MRRSKWGVSPRVAAMVVVALLGLLGGVFLAAPPAVEAQSVRSEHEQVRRQRADVASDIDTMKADSAQIDSAIRDIDANVAGQQELAFKAANAAIDAGRRAAAAEAATQVKAREVADLRDRVARIAVSNYISPPNEGLMDQMRVESANVAARKHALIDVGSQRASDLLDQLRGAQHELESQRAEAERAKEESERQAAEAERRQGELAAAKAQKQGLAQGLEARLNAKLGEAAALAAVDSRLASQLRAEQDALVAQLRQMSPPRPDPGDDGPSSPSTPPPVLPSVPLTTVRGITVNSQVAGQVEAMLVAAEGAGIQLSGSGYRSTESQISLRRQHCGTSQYAIWEMPVWQCTPPTAIPGTSMHERGLAIDFSGIPQYPGDDNAKFNWLKANAASYGFYNLPSEGWHWSTSGG